MTIKPIGAVLFLILLLNLPGLAQQKISGIISSEDGPLIGATLLEKGTDNGTNTDFDGVFNLEVNPGAILVIEYIGMLSQELATSPDQASYTLNMEATSSFLDEVVVVGYGNQKRSNISGAVGTITAEEVKESASLRVEQALQGRTSGVQVTQKSGSPGSELAVAIRGLGSLQNSNPLYVVDGIVVDGMDFLNVNDIESISVLKDAASAAIYGARAANGVVLIQTKTGSKTKVNSISLHSYTGVQSVNRYLDLLNAREYAVIQNEAYTNAGRVPIDDFRDVNIFNEGTDWQRAVFNDAPVTSHQLSIKSGGEGYNVGASGSYFKQEGIMGKEKSNFERRTARILFDTDVKPWLNVGTNVSFTNLTKNSIPENSEFVSIAIHALNIDPITPTHKPDGTFAYSDYLDTDIRNPLNSIANSNDKWESNRVVGSITSKTDILDNLKFTSSYGVDATFANQKGFIPIFNLSVDTIDAPAQEVNRVNTVSINNNTWRYWQWENYLNYDLKFDNQDLNLVLGTSINEKVHNFNGGANTDLPSNDVEEAFLNNTISPIESQSTYEGVSEVSFLSYFGRANYNFGNTWSTSFTMRVDGSSKFGKNNKYGYFPSVSVAYKISEASFFDVESISSLKLRASWGQNGNDRIGDYGFTSVVNNGQNYSFGPDEIITNGSVPLTVSNPDLKWETVTQTNFGLDLELLDGQVYFETDYYIKNTSDMLYVAPTLAVVGAFAPFRNIGDVQNKGWEFSLQYRGKINSLKYNVGGNLSLISNKVINLGGGRPTISGSTFVAGFVSRTEEGQPIASFYGYETDGLFDTQAEVEAHAFQTDGTAPGDIRFKDLNGDGMIDEEDKTFIGNPTPDKVFGITFGLEFANFDLGVFLQGVRGNKIFNAFTRFDKIGANRTASVLDRWTGPGTSDSEPRVSANDPNNNARVSDRFIEDGAYVKLRAVQLGYALSSNLLKKLKCQKLRFYVAGHNLLTFTKYSGFDPEVGQTGALDLGIDRGFYPGARMVLGGMQITL